MGAVARFLAVAMFFVAGGAVAQPFPEPAPSTVLFVDPNALFAETMYGRRVQGEVNAQVEAFNEENERIRAELEAEEQDLTVRRPTMDPAAFREEAAAFDTRVQQIRAEQDAKQEALQELLRREIDQFNRQSQQVLLQIMAERGASMMVSPDQVYLILPAIDITALAIERMDAFYGDGSDTE